MEYDGAARPEEQDTPALPRRSAQEHLEPQLREERGAGTGTPFAPFTPTEQIDGTEPVNGGGSGAAEPHATGTAGAAFRDGADGAGSGRPDPGSPRRRARHALEPDED